VVRPVCNCLTQDGQGGIPIFGQTEFNSSCELHRAIAKSLDAGVAEFENAG
jgi:hypothetical protein